MSRTWLTTPFVWTLVAFAPTVARGELGLLVDFLPGDFGYSATASLIVDDLNNDGLITADAGFYNIYTGPSEVAEASIDFFVNGTPLVSYDNADNFVLTYPFLIFGYDIGSNSIENFDLGADPGAYAVFVPSFNNDPNGQFFDTNLFGFFGGIRVTVIPEPASAAAWLVTTALIAMRRQRPS